MIEELKVLQGIVGDLSSMGVWVFIGYILYSLAKTILTFVASLWLIHKISLMAFEHFKAPYSKAECKKLEDEKYAAIRDTENTKHQFKIMKEKLSNELESVRKAYESEK